MNTKNRWKGGLASSKHGLSLLLTIIVTTVSNLHVCSVA